MTPGALPEDLAWKGPWDSSDFAQQNPTNSGLVALGAQQQMSPTTDSALGSGDPAVDSHHTCKEVLFHSSTHLLP